MTSSRVGHSLTGGGHVLQDLKEAMKVACVKVAERALARSETHHRPLSSSYVLRRGA